MDRLAQLQASVGVINTTPPPPGLSVRDRSSLSLPAATTKVAFAEPVSDIDEYASDAVDAFLTEVQHTMDLIQEVKLLVSTLHEKQMTHMHVIDLSQSKALRSEISSMTEDITNTALTIRETLGAMQRQTTSMWDSPEGVHSNSALVRIRENEYAYLLGKLMEIMTTHQHYQSEAERMYIAQTERQIKIKYTNMDGTAIDDSTAEQLALQVMENKMNSYIFQQSKDVLASIIETRDDIYRIETSMRELNQLFNDLAFLVHEQGELLDVVLVNVQRSTRYVESGREELRKARKYQKKSRKKVICLIVCVVVVIALFIIMALLGGLLPVPK